MRIHSALASIVVIGLCAPLAHADTFGAAKIDDAFTARVHAVCADASVKMTPAARTACTTNAFPATTATGDAFSNRGIGAEFNVLIRNMTAPVTASK